MAWTYEYTTQSRMSIRLSTEGVTQAITDPSGSGTTTNTSAVADAITRSTTTANYYLQNRYYGQEAALSTNEYVIDRCTDIANYYLCIQKGNKAPASIQKRYDVAIEEFKSIMNGLTMIPGLTPTNRKNWIATVPIHQWDRIVGVYPPVDQDTIITDQRGEPQ